MTSYTQPREKVPVNRRKMRESKRKEVRTFLLQKSWAAPVYSVQFTVKTAFEHEHARAMIGSLQLYRLSAFTVQR